MHQRQFTVDAALLRELGERLVGRPHIAVAELIKNAYDADASTCEVRIERDRIVIADNGEGMDQRKFEQRYLHLGTQHRRDAGVSRRLKRPLTGAKGVGRLATQFLGERLRIETVSERRGGAAVVSEIDWSKIKSGKNLQSFKVNVATVDRSSIAQFPEKKRSGTRITIQNLKVDLEQDDIESLGREVWGLRSPFERFGSGRSRGSGIDPDDFEIRFDSSEIEFKESFDAILRDLVERVWRAKITGKVSKGRTSNVGEIDIEFQRGYPANAPAETWSDRIELSKLRPIEGQDKTQREFARALLEDVKFEIYVYRLERRQKANVPLVDLRDYLGRFGNVSIYDAGFRLPYYGIDTDWLRNGADYSRRLSISSLLPSKWGIESRYMTDLPDPRRLFGIVEINTGREAKAARRAIDSAEGHQVRNSFLEIQPGRDRLHDNDAYRQLQAFVRYALDLYANRFRVRCIRAAEESADHEPPARKYRRLTQLLDENRDVIPNVVYLEARDTARNAAAAAKSQENQFAQRVSAIAPLAAAGMTALAMTHELNREMRSLDSVRRQLRRIARERDLPDVTQTAKEIGQFVKRIQSLQSLFSPLLSKDDREQRSRLRAKPVVRQVADGMEPLTPGMAVTIEIDEEMRFPTAPIAAWNAILQNVIANAWNACLATEEARVEIKGFEDKRDGGLWISDTGVGIDLDDADRLFDAFERSLQISREHEPVAIGGSGMGLTIVRMLAEAHKADVNFVEPEPDYSTTLQISWRK